MFILSCVKQKLQHDFHSYRGLSGVFTKTTYLAIDNWYDNVWY